MKYSRLSDILCLDIEATGSDPARHQVLQIGAVHYQSGDEFNVHIRYNEVIAQAEAFGVHGIAMKDLNNDDREPLEMAEYKFKKWLLNHRATDRSHFIPVGYNVSSYDTNMILRQMPGLKFIISYRSIDLNSVAFYLDLKRAEVDLGKMKEEMKGQSNNPNKHDALADAREARDTLRWLLENVF